MTLNRIFKVLEKLIADNSPNILTGFGVAGVATTAFLTGKATFRAADLIAKETREARRSTGDTGFEFHNKYKVKLVWKEYIPAIGTGIFTVASVIAANRIGTRRAAAMAAAYSISEKAFGEYREKVVERLGEKKEIDIRDDIAQDRVNRGSKEIVVIGPGNILCFDSMTGRYFESTMETLRKAQNDLNHQILHDSYATLHDFYKLIGLPPTKYSQEVGWTDANLLDIQFSTCLSADNRPCISIDYSSYPVRDYY